MKKALAGLLAACGSGGNAPVEVDAPTFPDSGPHGAMIVQQLESGVMTGTTGSLAIAPTNAGNLLIAAVALTGTDSRVATIAAAAGPFGRDDRAFIDTCGRTFEMWSRREIDADVTMIDVELLASATFVIYAFEVAGLSRFPLVDTSRNFDLDVPVGDLSIRADTGDLVFASITACNDPGGFEPDPAFTALGIHEGTGLVFTIAPSPSQYGVRWILDDGAWFQSAVTYR